MESGREPGSICFIRCPLGLGQNCLSGTFFRSRFPLNDRVLA